MWLGEEWDFNAFVEDKQVKRMGANLHSIMGKIWCRESKEINMKKRKMPGEDKS